MNQKFKISKWIFLALAVLMNGMIVTYSSLPMEATVKLNSFFTNIFSGIVNIATEKPIKTIPITSLEVFLSDDQYNYIPGYNLDEIPLGSAKEITCSFEPINATNTTVEYYTEDNDIVTLNQKSSSCSVVGMKTGTATIYAKNRLSGIESSVTVNVINTIAPANYEISVQSQDITLGSYKDINIDIDGGPLGHNEVHNSRYYDIRKLTYTSSKEDVLTVDNYGVAHPKSTGSSVVTVSNSVISKQLTLNVVSGGSPITYDNLHIAGDNICHGNDFIYVNRGVQLNIYDGDELLNPNDFIWSVSDELLVNVDRHGFMRGFRKHSSNDETATVTATSKINGQQATFEVVIKEELPTSLSYSLTVGGKTVWNKKSFTACVGDNVVLTFYLNPRVINNEMSIATTDSSLIDITNQGSAASLYMKGVGKCSVSFECNVNTSLRDSIEFTILKAGSMSSADIIDANFSIRKVVGHAMLFAVAQVFTFLALYTFLYEKKLWIHISLSLTIGLMFAALSETIEKFIPQRSGTFKDVMIDFAGVVVGAILTIGVIHIIKLIKKKKENKVE